MPLRVLRLRSSYVHFAAIQTRWMDQDAFGHVNNVQYYSYIDSTICRFLTGTAWGGPNDPAAPKPFVAHSSCHYHSPITFPEDINVGMAVSKVGRSSVTYKLGLFPGEAESAAATGTFVHVWTDPVTQRPVSIPDEVREAYATVHNDALHL